MNHEKEHISLEIQGMDCANCALGITKKLIKSGNTEVQVNFATGDATLTLSEANTYEDVVKDVESLGYKVVTGKSSDRSWFNTEKKFFFCLIFTIPLFLGHILFSENSWLTRPIVQLLICIPVFLVGTWHFGKSAIGSLRSGIPNMDVLIVIGSTAAFVYSLTGMLLFKEHHLVHQYLFFETTATIITLVLLGNLIEHISVKKTTSAIGDLTALQPSTAHRIVVEKDGERIENIAVDAIRKDDLLLVNSGESIPADGKVVSGTGSVNESMLTGESLPADKKENDPVIGGTLLLDGPIKIRISRTGSDTTLAKIIQLVKQAQHDKPPIQQFADKISAVFVPIVLAISLVTLFTAHYLFHLSWTGSILNSIAVLVISCPCAMGLATPTAVMVGIGRAAKNGILIRGGRTLEQLSEVKTIVFDKTGTLTTGKFSDIQINLKDASIKDEVEKIFLKLERNSSHPLATSIVEILGQRQDDTNVTMNGIVELKGMGVQGFDSNSSKWQIGSWRMLQNKADLADADIYILKDGKVVADVNLKDEIRLGMKEVISFCNAHGIKTVLLSGDRKNKCAVVAETLGMQEVHAEQLPDQKSALIVSYSKAGKTAMVGDGINDAPALAQADIGISPGDGSQVAMSSAQVVLLGKDGLSRISDLILLSKASVRTIKQNLFWALFYNVIAIPIAAFGFLSPMIAALAMAFSDVIVIGNSILLRTRKLKW